MGTKYDLYTSMPEEEQREIDKQVSQSVSQLISLRRGRGKAGMNFRRLPSDTAYAMRPWCTCQLPSDTRVPELCDATMVCPLFFNIINYQEIFLGKWTSETRANDNVKYIFLKANSRPRSLQSLRQRIYIGWPGVDSFFVFRFVSFRGGC